MRMMAPQAASIHARCTGITARLHVSGSHPEDFCRNFGSMHAACVPLISWNSMYKCTCHATIPAAAREDPCATRELHYVLSCTYARGSCTLAA
jgi:hypothetical protein